MTGALGWVGVRQYGWVSWVMVCQLGKRLPWRPCGFGSNIVGEYRVEFDWVGLQFARVRGWIGLVGWVGWVCLWEFGLGCGSVGVWVGVRQHVGRLDGRMGSWLRWVGLL